ncbi:MAG: hypothetical protein KJ064_14815 [Anaerolineae bacterium]|nr:hypothetical protein [Anaerolineae bacterium]
MLPSLGPQPCEVVTWLHELDCRIILGNHETDVLDSGGMEQRQDVPRIVIDAVKRCAQQLSDQQLQFTGSPLTTMPFDPPQHFTKPPCRYQAAQY